MVIPDPWVHSGALWSWSYGNWIYNCLCNRCLSAVIWTLLMARCTGYNIMLWSLSVTCFRSVVFFRYFGFLHQQSWLLR